MEIKSYFTVQEKDGGYNITKTSYYERFEASKAIKHFLRKKSNHIFYTKVTLLDKAPYAKTAVVLPNYVWLDGKHEEMGIEFVDMEEGVNITISLQ